MKKQSLMGSSKYEHNPSQLDIDVAANRARLECLRKEIQTFLDDVIGHDPVRGRDNWNLLIEVMREEAVRRNK